MEERCDLDGAFASMDESLCHPLRHRAVSGAIVEFELSLLWPTWIDYSGSIIGLLFALEGFAFFIEGFFLGIYIYGAKRLSPFVHWLTSFPIWLSGVTSAWFVVSANS